MVKAEDIWATLPRTARGSLALLAVGQGPSVVLLHSVGLRAEAGRAQIDALAQDHQVIAPDMPGHGQSPVLAGLATIADYADQIRPVLTAVDAPPVIIGHSMGALIGLELACRGEKLVSGVVALNAIFERSTAAAKAVKARAAELDGYTLRDPTPTLARWFGQDKSTERNACAGWLRGVDPKGYVTAYAAFAHANGPDRVQLAKMDVPALFITGADEPNATPAMSKTMAQIAPLGQAMIIDDAAHMMPMTHAQKVNAALHQFIARVGA